MSTETKPLRGDPFDDETDDDATAAARQQDLKKPAVTAKGKGRGKGKKVQTKSNAEGKAEGKAKGKSKGEANNEGDEDCSSQKIEPPFTVQHRWRPMHNAQAILLGTVDGEAKKFVTSVSVHTSPKSFCQILQNLHVEANDGAFTTKKDAIDRRDELIEIYKQVESQNGEEERTNIDGSDEMAGTTIDVMARGFSIGSIENQEGLN